jgi:Polysaccharide lyase
MSRRITAALAAAAVTLILASGGASGRSTAPGQQLPQNQTLPSITGSAVVPNTLTLSTGTWKGKGLKFAYQWLRCDSAGAGCSAITGATGSAKTLSTADVGSTLRVVVTASNQNGSTAATSAQTAVVTAAASPPPPSPVSSSAVPPSDSSLPVVSGTPQQNQTLSTSTGSWSGTTPMTYTYQWQRCDSGGGSCAPISGATAANYVLAAPDVGSTLRTSVTASNSAGSASGSSDPTAVVTAVSAAPAGTVDYQKTWEEASIDGGGWSHQCADDVANGSIVRGTVQIDGGFYDSPTHSGRFDLPVYPNTGDALRRTACELVHGRQSGNNLDDYYAVSLRVPSGWNPSTAFWGILISQFNYNNVAGATVGLNLHQNDLTVVVNAGQCQGTGCPYYSGDGGDPPRNMPGPLYAIPGGQLTQGVWHQVLVHVYWTTDLRGVLEVWHREKGQSAWTKMVDLGPVGSGHATQANFPTLQTGCNEFNQCFDASNIATASTSDKFGGYRAVSNNAITFWLDSWCRATSFDTAASCLG